jgi:ribonuclease HI
MGTEEISTVYAAELRAIEHALWMLKQAILESRWQDRLRQGRVVFSDSQAALQALRRPRMPSGQIFLVGCSDLHRWLSATGNVKVEYRWIPAHEGIQGNEATRPPLVTR